MARVLVIDDSPMLLELTVRSLTAAGHEAETAADLAQIEAQLAKGPFDLILVDVNMPEMFGDDVVEFLRKQRKVTAKLLLYSEATEQDLEAKAKAAGADGFISKSRGIESMLQKVAEAVGKPVVAHTSLPKPGPPTANPTAAAPPRKRRILVVDDSETTAMLLEAELKAKGFEVHTADSADKATKIILKKQTRPDLVLLDVRMPNVNGEQFCRFIKSNSLFKGIKVLLCSGEEPAELQRICREAGADGYMAKEAVLAKVLAGEFS